MKGKDLENRAQAAASAACKEFGDTLGMLSAHAFGTILFMRGYTAGFGDAADRIAGVPAPPRLSPNRCPLCGQDYAQVWNVSEARWNAEPCNCTRANRCSVSAHPGTSRTGFQCILERAHTGAHDYGTLYKQHKETLTGVALKPLGDSIGD